MRGLTSTALGRLGLILGTITLAAGLSFGAQAEDLTWGLRDTPKTLFAPTNYSDDIQIMSLIQDQILTFGDDGSLQPDVATSWEAPDPLTYVYTIRTDTMFSDGSPVTAEDVAYSLNLHMDPAVASQEAGLFADVESVTAEGDKVTVKLKRPTSIWKYLPASIAGYVWKKDSVSANLSTYGTPQTLPVGSGPYMVAEYVFDSHVKLVRNPHYTGEPAKFDTITFRIIPDDQTRFLAMQAGEIDGTFVVPATALAQWQAVADLTSFSSNIWRGFTLDMTDPPFDDIHVRKALYQAIDRQAIAVGLLGGLAEPSTTVNAPEVFTGSLPPEEIEAGYAKILDLPFDVAAAKAELAQSSQPNGFATTLNVPEDSATISQIAQAVKASWAAIGVDLTLNLMPGGPRFQVILDHQPHMGVQVIGNVPDVPDPVQMAYQYFSSAQAVKDGNNSSNYKDPTVDNLLAKAAASTDPAEAAKLVLEAQALASQDVPIIPLVWQKRTVALKKGWTMDGLTAFYNMTVWPNRINTGS
jgi:peptide/nickel transport system substrate-binding protein